MGSIVRSFSTSYLLTLVRPVNGLEQDPLLWSGPPEFRRIQAVALTRVQAQPPAGNLETTA